MQNSALRQKTEQDLKKSLKHLEYSYKKVQKIDFSQKTWDEETLETLESFSARFARTTDIFTNRYLKLIALEKDPAFQGPFIDLLNFSEKIGTIPSAKTWFRIRELRNLSAHEYAEENLVKFYKEVFDMTPEILSVLKDL